MLRQRMSLYFQFRIVLIKTRHVTKLGGCFSYLSEATPQTTGRKELMRLGDCGKKKKSKVRRSRYPVNLNFKQRRLYQGCQFNKIPDQPFLKLVLLRLFSFKKLYILIPISQTTNIELKNPIIIVNIFTDFSVLINYFYYKTNSQRGYTYLYLLYNIFNISQMIIILF